MIELKELFQKMHDNAYQKGFWNNILGERQHISGSIHTALLLVISEIGEAVEARRHGKKDREMQEELADILIRLGDLIVGYNLWIDYRWLDQAMAAPPDLYPVSENFLDFAMLTCEDICHISNLIRHYHLDSIQVREAVSQAVWFFLVGSKRFFPEPDGLGLYNAVIRKMEINSNRPHLHGKMY